MSNDLFIGRSEIRISDKLGQKLGEYVSLKWSDKDKAIAIQRSIKRHGSFKIRYFGDSFEIPCKTLLLEKRIVIGSYETEWLENECMLLAYVKTDDDLKNEFTTIKAKANPTRR